MNNTLAELEERLAEAKRANTADPLDPDEIEMMMSSIITQVGRLDRMCNSVLLRPSGLSYHVVDYLQLMKVMTSHLRWHLDHPAGLDGKATTS